MVKKYKDAEDFFKTTVLDESLHEYDFLMKSIPNFDKSPRC